LEYTLVDLQVFWPHRSAAYAGAALPGEGDLLQTSYVSAVA
jgi:hypothetical protein